MPVNGTFSNSKKIIKKNTVNSHLVYPLLLQKPCHNGQEFRSQQNIIRITENCSHYYGLLLFVTDTKCVIPENIHAHPTDHWKFQGSGGSQTPTFLKESMKRNQKFSTGVWGSKQKNYGGIYGYFLEQHIVSCIVGVDCNNSPMKMA